MRTMESWTYQFGNECAIYFSRKLESLLSCNHLRNPGYVSFVITNLCCLANRDGVQIVMTHSTFCLVLLEVNVAYM